MRPDHPPAPGTEPAAADSSLRVPAILLTLVMVGYLLHLGRFLFLPLVIAFLLCNLAQPLVRRMRSYGVPWGVTVGGVMILLVIVLSWVGGQLYDSARDYLQSIEPLPPAGSEPDAVDVAAPAEEITLADLERVLRESLPESWGDFRWEQAGDELKTGALRMAGMLGGAAAAVLGLVNQVLLVLFFMLFIFAERSVSHRKLLYAAGPRRAEAAEVMASIERDVQKYLGLKTAISIATGALCGIGLWLLDVPYASIFALLTFLLNYIPTFGSILAAVFPVAAAWAHHGTFGPPVAVVVIYLAVNLVLGNVIEPKVLGRQLNLSPLVILVAVLFWSALWGIPGMFLAVPLTRTVQLVFANVPSLKSVAILMSNGVPEDEPAAA